ncbi:MAG: JmjC domain-containing protein [Pseudomonadota bacterium]
MKKSLRMLNNLTAREFLTTYWQKKPLLIRQAFPEFSGLLDPQQLIALACTEDAQARLITQKRAETLLDHGPFAAKDFSRLGKKDWTVLVQSINHHLPEAAELLKHFSFIPHARLDDLMVSYAPQGGGVGPHFDSYDVFLLQGMGQRRWQISAQTDNTLVEGAPIRVLKNFKAEQEWILDPGDMLYLPPHYAHNGIAENDCMTYSIGFRAPSHHELAEQFLVHLQDHIAVDGMYADPDLRAQRHPSEIGTAMLRQISRAIRKVRWDKDDIARFTGCYLSEPKPHIFFDPPQRPISQGKFKQVALARGVALDLKSLMLCHGNRVFINGEAHQVAPDDYRLLRALADERRLVSNIGHSKTLGELLYRWYLDGYISPL